MKIRHLYVLVSILCACQHQQPEQNSQHITFEASDQPLINPNKGLQTFNAFNPSNHKYASVAYFRATWAELEPEEGKYAFDITDQLMKQAQAENQKIAFRFQAQKIGAALPNWLKDKAKGTNYTIQGKKEFVPDYDDPYFLEQIQKLITAYGERYNGNPHIDHVDIGMVGEWGEWHFTSFDRTHTYISKENKLKIVDWYLKAFDKTQLIALINDPDALVYAVSKGAGWRADSWGDYGRDGTGQAWNHMEDMYPQYIQGAQLGDVWKTAPIAFETSGNIDLWHKAGMSDALFQKILDWALEHHATYINNKSAPVPERWKKKMETFNQQLGYRLELQSLHWQQTPQGVDLQMEWKNTGVAPLYTNVTLWVDFLKEGKVENTIRKNYNGRDWLPGSFRTDVFCPAIDGTCEIRCKLTTQQGDWIHIASRLEKIEDRYKLCTIHP